MECETVLVNEKYFLHFKFWYLCIRLWVMDYYGYISIEKKNV